MLEGEDVDAIKQAAEELAQASHKLAEQLYAQKQQEEGAAGPAGAGGCAGGGCGGGAKGAKPADDNVVDADYTEVK